MRAIVTYPDDNNRCQQRPAARPSYCKHESSTTNGVTSRLKASPRRFAFNGDSISSQRRMTHHLVSDQTQQDGHHCPNPLPRDPALSSSSSSVERLTCSIRETDKAMTDCCVPLLSINPPHQTASPGVSQSLLHPGRHKPDTTPNGDASFISPAASKPILTENISPAFDGYKARKAVTSLIARNMALEREVQRLRGLTTRLMEVNGQLKDNLRASIIMRSGDNHRQKILREDRLMGPVLPGAR